MMRCACCSSTPTGVVMLSISAVHELEDENGKVWSFEFHPYSGPAVLRKDGEIAKRQPGERSAFWTALWAWQMIQAEPI